MSFNQPEYDVTMLLDYNNQNIIISKMERDMVKRLFKLVLVFAISSSLLSCASTQDEMQLLDSSVRAYERAIRWGEFTRAKSFHKKGSTLTDLERRRLKLYRVTGYSTLQTSTPDQYNSHILVEIKYIKNDRQVIKTITVKQHWKRDKEGKVWYLNSPFPKFR